MKKLLFFVFWILVIIAAYIPPAKCESFPVHHIIALGDRSPTVRQSRQMLNAAFSRWARAAGARGFIAKETRVRARHQELDLNNFQLSYNRQVRHYKKLGQRDGYKFAEIIISAPPLTAKFPDGSIRHAIGGVGEQRCSLWQYGTGRNYMIVFAQVFRDNGESALPYVQIIYEHEWGHVLSAGHRNGYNLMNPDALGIYAGVELPILPATVQEVKRCVRGLR